MMKIKIKPIGSFFRVYYDLGHGENSVPFDTAAEAEAFERGIEHALSEVDSIERRKAWLAKRAKQP